MSDQNIFLSTSLLKEGVALRMVVLLPSQEGHLTVELESCFSREWDQSDAVRLILQDSFFLPFFTEHLFRLTSLWSASQSLYLGCFSAFLAPPRPPEWVWRLFLVSQILQGCAPLWYLRSVYWLIQKTRGESLCKSDRAEWRCFPALVMPYQLSARLLPAFVLGCYPWSILSGNQSC